MPVLRAGVLYGSPSCPVHCSPRRSSIVLAAFSIDCDGDTFIEHTLDHMTSKNKLVNRAVYLAFTRISKPQDTGILVLVRGACPST